MITLLYIFSLLFDINNLRISTFDLQGWKNYNAVLPELCECHDLLVLQEHWLSPANLDLINAFHSDFNNFTIPGVLDIETYAAHGGRQQGSIAIMWRKIYAYSNVFNCCR